MSFLTKIKPDRHTPLLIVLGIAFSWFAAAITAFMLLLAAVDALILRGLIPFEMNRREVTSGEFLLSAGLYLILIAGYFAATAWGLSRHRKWVRFLVLAYHVGLIGIGLATGESQEEAIDILLYGFIMLTFASWYFFRKANVVAYFSDETPAPAASSRPLRPAGITLLVMLLASQVIGAAGNAVVFLSDHPQLPIRAAPLVRGGPCHSRRGFRGSRRRSVATGAVGLSSIPRLANQPHRHDSTDVAHDARHGANLPSLGSGGTLCGLHGSTFLGAASICATDIGIGAFINPPDA